MTAHAAAALSPAAAPSIWRQPMTVWSIAFACVVSFMGIGLVDPILPAISADLGADQVQTELLFTSYLLITGAAMLFTAWVSTRIGTKRTLLVGLGVIVVFALLCALSGLPTPWEGAVNWIIGFRAGWGLGNALFISTALAAIVGAASGGAGAAIVLYESALGLGIAIGPLVGGMLGTVSWMGPFFGVAALMAVGFILIVTLLRTPKDAPRPVPTRLSAPFAGLAREPGLRTMGIAALFYNFGFFTLLAWSPFVLPASFGAMGLGFVFFGWGLALAVTSIWGAPFLTRRFRRTSVLLGAFIALGLLLVVCGFVAASPTALIVCIILGGLVLGVVNTVLTESVMEATDLPRQVASGAYSAVRFIGGAIAPPAAAALATTVAAPNGAITWGDSIPFWAGAAALIVAIAVLAANRRTLHRVDHPIADELEEAEAIGVGDAD
ncbi:MAG: MFS transporter [Microbacteriaceae bacterium]|nr:MFS transporter [Microbacteriaceae bacterium]